LDLNDCIAFLIHVEHVKNIICSFIHGENDWHTFTGKMTWRYLMPGPNSRTKKREGCNFLECKNYGMLVAIFFFFKYHVKYLELY